MFRIIWPERRTVEPDVIDSWYADALANGDVDDQGENCSTQEKAFALHDAGLITLGRNETA